MYFFNSQYNYYNDNRPFQCLRVQQFGRNNKIITLISYKQITHFLSVILV